MAYALNAHDGRPAGPPGYTYASIVVRLAGTTRDDVLAALVELRFSGWIGQPEDGWLAVVADGGAGTVANGRRGVMDVAGWLAGRLGGTVLGTRVLRDRQLVLAAWVGPEEIGRYVSDPSFALPSTDDTLPDPLGTEHADAIAEVCGHPELGAKLADLLVEEFEDDAVFESERLAGVVRLLGLPRWLVSVASLPRDVPAGPPARDLTRLRAGFQGPAGLVYGTALGIVRRRLPPPPAFTGAPRGGQGMEPWMF